MATVGVVRGITLDVSDLAAAESFWAKILDLETVSRSEDYVWLGEVATGVRLILQRVPERKMAKNRMHLELTTPDPEALMRLVESMGGDRLTGIDDPDYGLTVMVDPDGNEFCIVTRPSAGLTGGVRVPTTKERR